MNLYKLRTDEGQGNQDLILEGKDRIRAVETWSWVVTNRKSTEPKNLQVENDKAEPRQETLRISGHYGNGWNEVRDTHSLKFK